MDSQKFIIGNYRLTVRKLILDQMVAIIYRIDNRPTCERVCEERTGYTSVAEMEKNFETWTPDKAAKYVHHKINALVLEGKHILYAGEIARVAA